MTAPRQTDPPPLVREALSVFVLGLALEAEIGLHPHERGRRQRLLIDVELSLDPAQVERIGETLDYDAVASLARRLAEEGHVDLVETYADRLASACLAQPRVRRARVCIEKPAAISDARAAGCEVVLSRG